MDSHKETARITMATRWSVRTLSTPRLLLSVLLISSCLLSARTVDANICSGCYNGGKLLLPNNVFGLCRCICPPRYKGLQCEFVGKRSGSPDQEAGAHGRGLNSLRTDYGRKLSVMEYIINQMKDRPDLYSGSKQSRWLISALGSIKRGN